MKNYLLPFLLSASFGVLQSAAQSGQIEELDALTIESSPLEVTTQAWSVLADEKLDKAKGVTIADTLSDIPGISQTTFGPTANRPMIRGLDKFRIRMLQNGTDTFDVSAQSEDHAVPVDPLMVDRIEVLRGASALLYGGSAIGGVVNIIDRSIPTSPYDSSGASVLSSYTSINEGLSYGTIAYGSSDKLSYQLNVSKRDYNDYDAPTFYTEDHHATPVTQDGPFETVENSHSDSTSFGFGASYKLDSGFAGFSFSSYENSYGVPGEHAESNTSIDMESDRFEFRYEIDVTDSDWLTGINLNFGYGDYKHSESGDEIDVNGTRERHVHATYLRDGLEGRIAFEHEIGDLQGVFGIHALMDEFKIEGDESILGGLSKPLPSNDPIGSEDSSKIALFLIEEYDLDNETTLNGGIRWESIDRDYETNGSADVDDTILSASGGISRDLNELWTASANVSYSERLPDTAELYSDGAHHATEAYEIGNRNLGTETAVGVEVILKKTVGKVTGQLSAFHTKFDNYVFLEEIEDNLGNEVLRDSEGNLEPTGGFPAGVEGLPVKEYEAVDAEFQGIEVEIDWLASETSGYDLMLSAYGDMIRGKNKSEGANLPRIPATRVGLGFEVMQEKLDFGMKLTRSMKQDKVSHHEESTPAYSLLNAFASYDVNFGDSVGELFVKGYNLTDELAYNHASVLKQFVPLTGRSVEVGLKFDF